MLKFKQHTECPPDQWRYKFREDGQTIRCFSYEGWIARIQDHRAYNGYPTPVNWIAEAEDQLCKLLPPGWCVQETGEPPPWFLDTRLGMEDVLRGTKVLASFVMAGAPLVDKETALTRAKVCAGCPFAISAEGCGACHGLSNAIAEVIGSVELETDAQLSNKMCAVCKCAARAQVWLPAEFLSRGVTDLMLEQFPEDWCWKRREVLQFRNSEPS
jgi:hypothetical protein